MAALYHEARPTYPTALVETVVSKADLASSAHILEVGPGTGQATALFARRGFSILGLEPGPNLAALAAQNLKIYPCVTIENVSFEDWPLQEGQFDLLLSATAFHWVKPDGHLALLWNMPPDTADPVTLELDAVYDRVIPKAAGSPARQSLESRIQQIESEIRASKNFRTIFIQRFPWEERYETEQYLRLLETYSDHRLLPPEKRDALFHGIAEALARHGGFYLKPYIAVLYLTRKN